MSEQSFYTYILRCADGTLYTGWTTDLDHRLHIHNAGKGAKYTRGRLPVHLAFSWRFTSKTEALRFEWIVKRLSRQAKETLIAQGNPSQDPYPMFFSVKGDRSHAGV
jgi:putative endonuclease